MKLIVCSVAFQLDVCCGIGSIGLSLAGECGQVVGLDILGEAVDAALQNALRNNVTNCEYFPGR
jgi:tRNA/tmRNA/rRNA uracil-C5-methylase (TrmA/RlmC/RlmD family)